MIALVPRTAAPYSRLAISSGETILPATRQTKQMPDRLVEDQLGRHAGIGAGQQRGERRLRLGGLLLQQFEIVVERGHLTLGEALVAVHHRLQRRVRGHLRLGPRDLRQRDFRAPPHHQAGGHRGARAQQATPRPTR
jgi:hypothetical protein